LEKIGVLGLMQVAGAPNGEGQQDIIQYTKEEDRCGAREQRGRVGEMKKESE
jgi:hypothetical protein